MNAGEKETSPLFVWWRHSGKTPSTTGSTADAAIPRLAEIVAALPNKEVGSSKFHVCVCATARRVQLGARTGATMGTGAPWGPVRGSSGRRAPCPPRSRSCRGAGRRSRICSLMQPKKVSKGCPWLHFTVCRDVEMVVALVRAVEIGVRVHACDRRTLVQDHDDEIIARVVGSEVQAETGEPPVPPSVPEEVGRGAAVSCMGPEELDRLGFDGLDKFNQCRGVEWHADCVHMWRSIVRAGNALAKISNVVDLQGKGDGGGIHGVTGGFAGARALAERSLFRPGSASALVEDVAGDAGGKLVPEGWFGPMGSAPRGARRRAGIERRG